MTRAERLAVAAIRGGTQKPVATAPSAPAPSPPMAKSSRITKSHGGERPGSGAPPLDPAAGTRIMRSFRLHPDTIKRLQLLVSNDVDESQAQAIDAAIERRFKAAGLLMP